ncbi:K(+)-transporting ATPase subunit C [Kutzneria sp. CA-103260]|uniref:K(+)-transporting ATPase subunit C n=1 Tax=Kutzneria sp. CA-103260 TaxID=2802641 RepID=UPI002111D1EE|nr:K(+)-transporting ATPase subunit C [Kutzneria sp. CA-103260]
MRSGLFKQTAAGLRMVLLMTLLLGIVYPLAVWGVGQIPGLSAQANGSIVSVDGQPVGSSLIGLNPVAKDPNNDPYFHTRPSATASDFSATDNTKLGLADNDAATSSPSNLSADNPVLVAQIKARKAEIAKREGVSVDQVPADAVTASASGLDPAISPDYAKLQIARVARVTGLSVDQVTKIVDDNTSGRGAGFLGERGVNVLALNLAVQAAKH